jgi:hypothetical protein
MERENLYFDVKRKAQVFKHKAYIIDAKYRGGVARSSVEGMVIIPERRGHIIKDLFTSQLLKGGACGSIQSV